jgi:protein-tyrosine phosphatase
MALFNVYQVGLGHLSIARRPRGGDWLIDEIRTLRDAGVRLLVSMLTPEEEIELDLAAEVGCCEQLGVGYISLPVTDLGVPSDLEPFLIAIKRVVAALQAGQSVAVHCRQGIGRSGLFTCSVLVGLGSPLDKAIARTSAARGVSVPETADQRRWLEAHAHELFRDSQTSWQTPF